MTDTVTSYKIRIAHPSDAELIASLHEKCFRKPWTEKSFTELLSYKRNFCWIIASNPLVGFIIVRIIEKEAEILSLAVDQQYRRYGRAHKLIEHAFNEIQKLHVNICYLEVDQNNTAANQLYEKIGFSQIGLRKKYYNYSNNYSKHAKIMSYNWEN
tara:strand:- start:377 stop:844 length:468 start_codon:yes stop_codon:yes gene_type:complete